jgi:hypothetical protein
MILDAAETVLGLFGFDRTVYSDLKRNKGRKKWYRRIKRAENKGHRNRDALMLKEKICCSASVTL